jgi:hypothetical protein
MDHTTLRHVFTYYETPLIVTGLIIGDLRDDEVEIERVLLYPGAPKGALLRMIKAGLAFLKTEQIKRALFVLPRSDNRMEALAKRVGFTCYFTDENYAHYYREVSHEQPQAAESRSDARTAARSDAERSGEAGRCGCEDEREAALARCEF